MNLKTYSIYMKQNLKDLKEERDKSKITIG